jgi:hypothetical protein
VAACMAVGLVKGERFAVDAGVIEDDASRYHAIDPQWAFVGWALNTLSTNCRAEASRV